MTERAAAEDVAPPAGLSLRRAAWLADDVLIAACTPSGAGSSEENPSASAARLEGRLVDAPEGDAASPAAAIVVARAPRAALDLDGHGLVLSAGGARCRASAGEARAALTDLTTFVREHLAGRDAGARARLMAALTSFAAGHGLSPSLARGLHALREALRERHAVSVGVEGAERTLEVERLHRFGGSELYVRGRLFEGSAALRRLTAVSPEGERIELLGRDRLALAPRAGRPQEFACHFEAEAPTRLADGWVLEAENATGRSVETVAALSPQDEAAARRAVVEDAAAEGVFGEAVRSGPALSALTRLQELRRDCVHVVAEETHGAVPPRPDVSVIVPLYERIDLVEHQLAQFARDPELAECELLYVLDSPELAEHLGDYARELARLYELPFRTATLSDNGGVALARNLGASLAAGRLLLFLDSDVLPGRPGWIGALRRALDAEAPAGAAGPLLRYEDEAVQHAGLTFERTAGSGEWSLVHRLKGMHAELPAVREGGAVPGLSGACMMVDAALYAGLGGMSWRYVQGDFEDADFSLRLAKDRRTCLYVPEVSLYHLEAQSYPPAARAANRRYNRWLFTRLWEEALEERAVRPS